MRIVSLLTHSTTLFIVQQFVIVWFIVDFFLARDSATTDKIYNEHLRENKSALETLNKIEAITGDLRARLKCDDLLQKEATFDKLIFIVIDALGSEFIESIPNSLEKGQNAKTKYSNKLPFLEQSLVRHQAMAFVAKAATPTVTMPRIKALVSGTIPSFMDLIYNLASDVSNFHDDNLLKIAKSRKKSIIFYGDDTWLSLFDKTMFTRYRETLSLYATDYTTVDTNVTEMALPETSKSFIDWDFLILHYLGLDHIGHTFGTNHSPLIDKKLLEMDSVIQTMYNNMATKDQKTLILVCGDHGMSDEGNHGGDSRLESETAMLFLPVKPQLDNAKIYDADNKHVAQVDLAVTLSLLTGLPIPKRSRGVFIEPFLRSIWRDDKERMACAMIDNLRQLSSELDDKEFAEQDGLGIQILQYFNKFITNSPVQLGDSFVQQGLSLARTIQASLVRIVTSKTDNFLIGLVVAFVVLLSIINMRRACYRLLMPLMSTSERLTCLGAILVPILMLNSTDFIEMEHIFWPIFSLTVMALFCLIALKTHPVRSITQDLEHSRIVHFVMTFIITVTWNHSIALGRHDWGWFLPVISVIIFCNFTRQTSNLTGKLSFIPFSFGLLVLATKFFEESHEDQHGHVALLQVFTAIMLLLANLLNIYVSFKRGETQPMSIVQKLATSWMWWVLLLSRSRNYIFLISNVVMEASLNSLANSFRFSPIMRAITYLQFASNAFYGQGNTNLFTTLDVKPAFYGQTQYNIVLAVFLITCSTFGSQIYWFLKLFQRVQGEKEQERMSVRPRLIDEANTSKLIPEGTKDAIKDFVDMRNFLTIAYYMFVCMVLRNHLFIWSVLSPKLVYLFVTTLTIRLVTATISNLPYLLVKILGPKNEFELKYKRIVE
jgi:ethanolaminephosphotransferase